MVFTDNSLEIRRLRIKDVDTVVALFNSCIKDEMSTQYPPEAQEYYCENVDHNALKKRINETRQVLLVAIRDNKIVGFILCGPIVGGVITVEWIVVNAAHRREGIGTQLVEAVFKRAKRRDIHRVQLYTTSQSAVEFYISCGFEQACVISNHWWNRDFYLFIADI